MPLISLLGLIAWRTQPSLCMVNFCHLTYPLNISRGNAAMYCQLLRSSLAVAFAAVSLLSVQGEDSAPDTWDDFMKFHITSGSFGTFQSEGVTKGMWEGIAAGQNYTATYTLLPSEDGKSVHASHRMETESGQVISIGAGLQYWDESTESILASYSGYDQGSLFTGSSTLKTFEPDNGLIEWIYTETSHGKTTKYLQTIKQTSVNEKMQASSKAEGGPAWEEVLSRVGNTRLKVRVRTMMPKLLRRN